MEIVLVPGFWLGAQAWREVVPHLERAGHRAHPLTLPGLERDDPGRAAVTVEDQVSAIVAAVDGARDAHDQEPDGGEPHGREPGERDVVLVGHSGGGPLVAAALDRRPERVARVIYVDSWPLSPGEVIPSGLTPVEGVVPLPDWGQFDDEDLVDLTPEQREEFRRIAVPEPGLVATGAIELHDDGRRRAVPATVIACEFGAELLTSWVEGGADFVAELRRLRDWEVVELPTGHWPMFTRPRELAEKILEVID
jgi:pimeloyl-ACP methyl ester carboxylesterase